MDFSPGLGVLIVAQESCVCTIVDHFTDVHIDMRGISGRCLYGQELA